MDRLGFGMWLAVVGLAACGASVPPPRAEEAASALAVRNAQQADASRDLRARLRLQQAEEQLENGRALMRDGDHRTAAVVLRRAKADADAARALAPVKLPEPAPKAATSSPIAPPAIGGGPVETPKTVVEDPPKRDDHPEAARQAMDKIAIAAVGTVRIDERGTVISIPASSLFNDEGNELSPAAAEKLRLVDEALDHSDGHAIVVEGYTDSQGDPASKRALSQRRADAVRAHLVARGAPADRVRAKGLGGMRPIADNDTVRGRARNHRIEILVQPIEEK